MKLHVMIYIDLNPKAQLKPQMAVSHKYFNVQQYETSARGNGWCKVPGSRRGL